VSVKHTAQDGGDFPTLYYAPQLAASGYANGKWVVAIPINYNGWNNVYMCTSDRGCGVVNAAADDQFLAGVSVSGDGGYWVSYLTYDPSYGIRGAHPKLITQAIYFAPGSAAIGATTNTGIDPTAWVQQAAKRCTGDFAVCYAAGDFDTVASNPFALATTRPISLKARIRPTCSKASFRTLRCKPTCLTLSRISYRFRLGRICGHSQCYSPRMTPPQTVCRRACEPALISRGERLCS